MNIADKTVETFAPPHHAYVPGVSNEPDRATLDPVKAQVPSRFEGFVPATHPAVGYGVLLNDAGFFWEAHEILEAVWKAAPQGGLDRICLRACIQVANANLKLKMGKRRAADRLIAEAADEFMELVVRRRGHCSDGFAASFPAEALAGMLRARVTSEPSAGPIILDIQAKI